MALAALRALNDKSRCTRREIVVLRNGLLPVGQFPNTAGPGIGAARVRRLYSCPGPCVQRVLRGQGVAAVPAFKQSEDFLSQADRQRLWDGLGVWLLCRSGLAEEGETESPLWVLS
jgi:hypothetical protein